MFKKVREMLDGLIVTTPCVLENMKKLEEKKLYNDHVEPFDLTICEPVGADYPYIKNPLKLKISYFFVYNFIVKPFEKRELKRMGYSVTGKENIKGIKTAVVTSNHINKLDCTLNRKAFKPHKMYITAANFNNMKGLLGDVMRSSNMMPLGNGLAGMRSFDKAVNSLLQKNRYVLFYPEKSEWWCYPKPRPVLPGAYHYATKNNVPIIPTFITFTKNGRTDKNGIELFNMKVNILKPIYPKKELNNKENAKYLAEENYKAWKECYERTYNKKLVI